MSRTVATISWTAATRMPNPPTMNDGFATAMPPVATASSECGDEAQADEDQIGRECELHLALLHLMGEVDAIAHR